MKLTIYILLLASIFIMGCQDDFTPDVSDETNNVVVLADLKAGESPEIKLKPTILIGEAVSDDRVPPAQVSITPENEDAFSLRYDDILDIYTRTDRTILAGLKYSLTVDIPGYPNDSISSNTSVPNTNVTDVAFSDVDLIQENEISYFHTEALLDLSLLDQQARFYKVRFFLEELIRTIDSNGVESFIVSENSGYMGCNDRMLEGGVVCAQQYDGYLLDTDAISNDVVALDLWSIPHDSSLDISANRVFFEISTLSESNYLFDVSLSNLIRSTDTEIGEPVVTYSNIENGLGFFGASNTSVDTISL